MNASEAHSIRFPSAGQPSLQLEGQLHLPPGRGPFPAVVIAHPHPLWGGTMDTPVLVTIAHTLAGRGWAALRFNFRGVGGSQGGYDQGCGETDDVVGALDSLALAGSARGLTTQERVDAGRLAVVGYSFGACVGGRAASCDERVRAYAAVALPMSEPYRVDLREFRRPKFFITGARDGISPPELLRQYVEELPEPKTLHVIRDADHMLWGYEQEVAERVADFLTSSVF